jgi:hypothetical protein
MLALDEAWHRVASTEFSPARVWTLEGAAIDQLMVFGVKDGESLSPARAPDLRFHAGMQPAQLAGLFGALLARDGSAFALHDLQRQPFAGVAGLRFEFALTRRADNARLAGLGYASVSAGELHAMLYVAPRLGFFPRHRPRVEALAAGARLR